jgi:hypothetical protein
LVEGPYQLKGPGYSVPANFVRRRNGYVPAIEPYLASVGLLDPADQIEQSAFAGPVGTNESQYLSLVEGEADTIDSHHPTKGLSHILYFKKWHS